MSGLLNVKYQLGLISHRLVFVNNLFKYILCGLNFAIRKGKKILAKSEFIPRMLIFERMYFLNQFACMLKISGGILKMYFMSIYFPEHQKQKYYLKSAKECRESKTLRI